MGNLGYLLRSGRNSEAKREKFFSPEEFNPETVFIDGPFEKGILFFPLSSCFRSLSLNVSRGLRITKLLFGWTLLHESGFFFSKKSFENSTPYRNKKKRTFEFSMSLAEQLFLTALKTPPHQDGQPSSYLSSSPSFPRPKVIHKLSPSKLSPNFRLFSYGSCLAGLGCWLLCLCCWCCFCDVVTSLHFFGTTRVTGPAMFPSLLLLHLLDTS